MTFNAYLSSNDAAFAEAPLAELARILRDIADRVERGQADAFIYDVNGNKIGNWQAQAGEDDV